MPPQWSKEWGRRRQSQAERDVMEPGYEGVARELRQEEEQFWELLLCF